jgi:DedD protein
VDTLVKERLTGAVILVGLIVVLVPELLSGPIRRPVNLHGPGLPAEEPPLRSYTINLADEPHGDSAAVRPQPSAPATAEPAAAPATSGAGQPTLPPVTDAPPPAPPVTTTPATAPARAAVAASAPPSRLPPAALAPAAATRAASSATAYAVQIGSFANRANAERLAQQVRALGYPVSV